MALVNISNIQVLDNPALFTAQFQFEITFECIAPLKNDLEWKMIYVGSAESSDYDQVLDSIMVGPVPVGVNKFLFTAPAPDIEHLPKNDVLGVTVVLLSCSYVDKPFVQVGYYVNNEYADEELRENPPERIVFEKLYRNILGDKPKVTRYPIDWDNPRNNMSEDMQTDEQQTGFGADISAEQSMTTA